MINIQSPSCFNCLPNELVLIIWTYLGHVEAIKIFGSMEYRRYTRLLEEYCYKSLSFRETSLSTFQLYCSHLFNKIRLDVQILKLGHRTAYSQLRIFTQMRPASLSLLEMFPKLQTLVLYNVSLSNSDDIEPYLLAIPFIQRLVLCKCSLKKVSPLICSNLLGHGRTSQLQSCYLHSDDLNTGFILHEPIPSTYQLQQNLIYLGIDIDDLVSLKNLLQFLPKLQTLDVYICKHVKRSDEKMFVSYVCPCIYLTKLIFRLLKLDLAFTHKDPAYRRSLVYIDGNLLFNELIIHMTKLEKINFCIETACLCDQQMESIIKSYQTEYWLSMLIGCHYDKLNHVYIVFSLPNQFPNYFWITTDVMDTQFNQTGYQINDLMPILFEKTKEVCVAIGKNEKLSSSLITLLKQGAYRGEEFISTTMTLLNWISYVRSLIVDAQMLLKLVLTINLNGTIDRFPSLEELIVRQLDSALDEDTLTVIAQLGVSSSLKNICVEQYKMLDTQSMVDNNFLLTICQICCNMHQLETLTIEFANPHSLFESTTLEELAGTEKKNCQFECIYVSDSFIQFWLEK